MIYRRVRCTVSEDEIVSIQHSLQEGAYRIELHDGFYLDVSSSGRNIKLRRDLARQYGCNITYTYIAWTWTYATFRTWRSLERYLRLANGFQEKYILRMKTLGQGEEMRRSNRDARRRERLARFLKGCGLE